jgi:menaquinone-dependent protoporphyrinogen oxidase
MSRLLVLYGTTDGHTAKVARTLADLFRKNGAEVDVVEAGAGRADPDPGEYAGVVVAASVHLRSYQRAVRRWVRAHLSALHSRPTAFLSVSLGVLQPEPEVQREVAAILEGFLKRTGWHPTWNRSLAGALPYSRYGWFKRLVMRRIARRAAVATDPSRDYEYTDWDALAAFAQAFLAGRTDTGTRPGTGDVPRQTASGAI